MNPQQIEYNPALAGIPVVLQPTLSTVTLDALGPVVVNSDGTLARISNWQEMSKIEQDNVMRVLPKRNKQRLDKLKQETDNKDL